MSRPIEFRAWDTKYEIGSDGSVWSLDFNHTGKRKQLRKYPDKDGYYHVFLTHHGTRSKLTIHRAVAILFLNPKPTNKHQVNHKNGVRTDNDYSNLEWVTPSENTLHGWRVNGRKFTDNMMLSCKKRCEGVANPKAKINHRIAEKMKVLRQNGHLLKDISGRYGLSVSQTSAITRGLFWK